MSRLIAFGCSYTYGHGLEDCVDEFMMPGPTASKLAWPQLLADKLNLECINEGQPGASNKQTWYKIINYKFRITDLVFILWSTNERHCIINKDYTVDQIGHWVKSKPSKMYYKHLFNEVDQAIDSNLRIEHCTYHLINKGIIHYNMLFRKDTIDRPSNATILDTNFRTIKHGMPRAVDKLHPGKEAHKKFAQEIYGEINET